MSAAAAPTAKPNGFRVSDWTELRKGEALRGFFNLELPSGLVIEGCSFHINGNNRWVSFPRRSFRKKTGEVVFATVISFASNEAKQKFQTQALDALARYLATQGDK